MGDSLYERLGGAAHVSQIVMTFYDKVVEDARIGHFFVNTDMQHLVDHQARYISSVIGGPLASNDEDLVRVHASVDISDNDFDIMMGLFRDALLAGDLSPDDAEEVCDKMISKRALIVA